MFESIGPENLSLKEDSAGIFAMLERIAWEF